MAKSAIKKRSWLLVTHVKLYIVRRPRLKRLVSSVLAYYPNLEKKLQVGTMATASVPSEQPHRAYDLANPTAHAQRIHAELKSAVERRTHGDA